MASSPWHSHARPKARQARGKPLRQPPAPGAGLTPTRPELPTHTGRDAVPPPPARTPAANGPDGAARPLTGCWPRGRRRRRGKAAAAPPHRARANFRRWQPGGASSPPPAANEKCPAPSRTGRVPAGGQSGGRPARRSRRPRARGKPRGAAGRGAGGARYLTVCHSHVRVLLSRLHLQLQGFLAGAGELQPRRQLLPGEEQLHAAPQQLLSVRRRSGHDPAASSGGRPASPAPAALLPLPPPPASPEKAGADGGRRAEEASPAHRFRGSAAPGASAPQPHPRLHRAPQPPHRAPAR